MSPERLMTHRFVVPSALVELLLAEHTTATLCSDKLGLQQINDEKPDSVCDSAGKHHPKTYMTTWSIMLKANFPTLVPPNFCTTQFPVEGLMGAPLTIGIECEPGFNGSSIFGGFWPLCITLLVKW